MRSIALLPTVVLKKYHAARRMSSRWKSFSNRLLSQNYKDKSSLSTELLIQPNKKKLIGALDILLLLFIYTGHSTQMRREKSARSGSRRLWTVWETWWRGRKYSSFSYSIPCKFWGSFFQIFILIQKRIEPRFIDRVSYEILTPVFLNISKRSKSQTSKHV